jgi:plasmid stability protein
MATITLKDIPPKIHLALKRRAKRHGRSLNREAVEILANSVAPHKRDVEAFVVSIRESRRSLPGRLSDDLLNAAKTLGRP